MKELVRSKDSLKNHKTMKFFKLDVEKSTDNETDCNHPIYLLKLENQKLERLVDSKIRVYLDAFDRKATLENANLLFEACFLLFEIDKHYRRIEKLLTPFLQEYVNDTHSHVNLTWRHYDFIRDNLSYVMQKLIQYNGEKQTVIVLLKTILYEIGQIIEKEENILFPLALNHLKKSEWRKIKKESSRIGYCFSVSETTDWKSNQKVSS